MQATVLGGAASAGQLLHAALDPHAAPQRLVDDVDELVWHGRGLTWCRGAQLYRRYTYEHEHANESISCAAFILFPVGSDDAKGKGVDRGADTAGHLPSTFGPFHTSQHAGWGQATARPSSGPRRLERALVVFLQTCAHVYFASGEDVVVHMPFVVDAAFPLRTGGALLQRALEPRERRRLAGKGRGSILGGMDRSLLDQLDDLDDGAPDLPRLYTLDTPLDELKVVVEGGSADTVPGPHAPSVPAHHHVVFVQDSLVVIYDRRASGFIFCRLASVAATVAPPPPKRARSMRPDELLRAAPKPRTSLSRRETAEHRASAATDRGDRGARRAPRLSKVAEGELAAALDGTRAPLGEPSRRRSSAGAAAAAGGTGPALLREGDVKHFMREDEFKLPAISEKELRETTMLMGLERDEDGVRSDVVLQRLWDWAPDRPVNLAKLRVFVTENLGSTYHLHIHLGDTLYTFHAQEHAGRTHFTKHSATTCEAALPIVATRHDVLDLLMLVDGAVNVVINGHTVPVTVIDARDDVTRQLASQLRVATKTRERQIVGLVDAQGATCTAVCDDGERARVSLDARPRGLVRQCLDALAYLLPRAEYTALRLGALHCKSWDSFAGVLRGATGLDVTDAGPRHRLRQAASHPIARRLAAKVPADIRKDLSVGTATALTAPVLLALHLVAQDCRLSSRRQCDLLVLAPLIVDLASLIGRRDWQDYWLRLVPQTAPSLGPPVPASLLDAFETPPDILAYLSRRLVTRTKPFTSPRQYAEWTELGQPTPCAQTDTVCAIYHLFGAANGAPDVVERAARTVHYLVDRGLDAEWVADLPPGVALPILEALRTAQHSPGNGWSADEYTLIGREDLAARSMGDQAVGWEPQQKETIRDVITGSKALYQPPQHVRFGQDRRVQEVERIMQTERQRTIAVQDPPNANDQQVLQYHQNVVNTIANRTLSITVGQGVFEFGTRSTTITDHWPIPLIELAIKVVPGNTVVKAQLAGDGAEWPCFHNGVSRALAISPDAHGLDSSWIVFNKPAALNNEHGGFLLGLGLTGHLRHIKTFHAFGYLEPRHETTSVGMLLGLACSFAGSRDVLVTKILSLHTHALLPQGSMDLQAPPTVQAAALLGIGLVYAGSRDLRTAEVALGEIGRKDMAGVDTFALHAEAYSFAASMGLGLTMLGRGGTSDVDKRIVAQLARRMHGHAADGTDATVTSPGATLALGLMYLKTGRQDVVDVLPIPQSAVELDSVRPDLLLVRTFARALIMWDSVRPTMAWFEAQLPAFIRAACSKRAGMELAVELAYLHMIGGACLAIGIKHAGTASEAAHNTLMTFFGTIGKAAAGQSMAYEGRIRRSAARQVLNVVTIALAVVMSGTGELNVLRRLRVSHGQEGAGVTYGSHMAMHMALGILFLGRGYYTLGDSDLAIAAMAIAFFPRFTSSSSDNKAYPQVFRHLWALAAEPRCLVARDVDTRATVYLPVKLRGAHDEHSLISPTLVAPFDTLRALIVESPRYWPVRYDLDRAADRASLVCTRTIWVKRKAGYADYSADQRGNRSIFVRAGAMTGFDMHHDLVAASAPPAPAPALVGELVRAHASDPALVAMAENFTGDTPLEQFVRLVLLECLSLDKPHLVPVYLDLFCGWRAAAEDGLERERQAQRDMAAHFLACSGYAAPAAPPGDKRFPLVRPSFVAALQDRTSVSSQARDAYLRDGAWHEPGELATYVAQHHVPPIGLLAAMRELVAGSGNGDSEATRLKMRDVAAAYAQAVTAQWDDESTPVRAASWDGQGVADALAAWG